MLGGRRFLRVKLSSAQATMVASCALVLVLAALQFVLDVSHVHSDPVLSDGFKLALSAAVASIAADRMSAQSKSS